MKTTVYEKILKCIFFAFFVKPFIFWVLGINTQGIKKLPKCGEPAIIVANHNSHIDTLLIMSLFQLGTILNIRPIAAKDYFCNTRFRTFIFKTLIGIIPIERKVQKTSKKEFFKEINEALINNQIIIIYPEGTRGEDDKLGEFKTGVAHIAKMNPNVPIIPLYINGPSRILPKPDYLPVPFISDIYTADPIYYDNTNTKDFTKRIYDTVLNLQMAHKRKEEL